ncbi:MAG: alkaline phosphatase D family protein, partial [Myxococcota bacterium]
MSSSRRNRTGLGRRQFIGGTVSAGTLIGLGCGPGTTTSADRPGSPSPVPPPAQPTAPAVITADGMRPAVPYGVQSGEVAADRAVLWSASDRPARMLVEWSTSERFADARRIIGPSALGDSGFASKLLLSGLPADQVIFYRVRFQDLGNLKTLSEPVVGRLRTAPAPVSERRSVRLLWSGDTAGQGWGINPEWGGMRIYQAMRERRPDVFIHCGDMIYADNPIAAEVTLPDGTMWRNRILHGKHKVAETLAEFRANFQYNLLDEHVRAFNAAVPQLVQWDDHEVTNNWYPGEILADDDRYSVKSAALLAMRGRRAMFEWTPISAPPDTPERIYRSFPYGPLVEVFRLDMRSYRGPNSTNRQSVAGPDTAFLGAEQVTWLKQALRASSAR